MSKFLLGDRVKVYCYGQEVLGADFTETVLIWSGTVMGHCDARGVLSIHPDGEPSGVRAAAHEKACRKPLKKERRRVWIHRRMDETDEVSQSAHGQVPPQICPFCGFVIQIPIGTPGVTEIFSHIRATSHCPADEEDREAVRNIMREEDGNIG